ncbi:MAG: hypothetical protein KAX67_02780 [Pararheinheimera sp.]|nr:hypothetical protein [Rheinheimera sp.]
MSLEKLPVPTEAQITLQASDFGSVFQARMNAVAVALRNAIIAFNAQIDAAQTASQQVEPAPIPDALEGTNNTYKMTPYLVDLVLGYRLGTTGSLGSAALATLTSSAIDPTVGRVMKVGDFGFGASAIQVPDLFFFDPRATGLYREENPPGAYPFAGILHLNSVDSFQQIQIERAGAGMIYRGGSLGVGVSPWKKVYDNHNIVGAVSEALGVPTGAVIEVSTGPSGTYIKVADGSLICFFVSTEDYQTNGVAMGGLYPSAAKTFFFPSAFASPPTIAPAFLALSGFVTQSNFLIETTSFAAELWGNAPTNMGRMGYIAYGRWK